MMLAVAEDEDLAARTRNSGVSASRILFRAAEATLQHSTPFEA
jgi:hypothetical protein